MVRIRKKLLENILHLRRNPIKVAVNFSEVRKQAKMYYCYVGELSEVQITSETQNKSAQFDFLLKNRIEEEVVITEYFFYHHPPCQIIRVAAQ